MEKREEGLPLGEVVACTEARGCPATSAIPALLPSVPQEKALFLKHDSVPGPVLASL